jgi:hypothetical protein
MKMTRRTTHLLTSVLVGVSLAGCEQPMPRNVPSTVPQIGQTAEPVMVETGASSYALGARISMRLVNRTGRPVRFDVCTSTLETINDDNVWRAVGKSLGEDCNSPSITLAPGQAIAHTFTAGPYLPAGLYRIRATLLGLDNASRYEVRSNNFMLTSRDSSG